MRYLYLFLCAVLAVSFSNTAHAGKKDEAWAKCIWENMPTSADNWIALPLPMRSQGISQIKPEVALQYRLRAACAKKLTAEGESRPLRFSSKKVRKSLIASKPEIIGDDKVEPMAFVCSRYFLNDTELKRPAAFHWGYGPDTSKVQFFKMSLIFSGQRGGVGLPDEGGLKKCERVKNDGALELIEDSDVTEAVE